MAGYEAGYLRSGMWQVTQERVRRWLIGTRWGLGPRNQAEVWFLELGHKVSRKRRKGIFRL